MNEKPLSISRLKTKHFAKEDFDRRLEFSK